MGKKRTLTDEAKWGYILVAPTIIGLIVLNVYPFIQTLILSFSTTHPFGIYEITGPQNYVRMFESREFWKATWNSIYFCILTVPAGLFLSLVTAVLLNAKIKGKTAFRAIYFLPMVVAPAAIAMVWKWIFNAEYGIINQMIGTKVNWLTNPSLVLPACAVVAIWSAIGYDAILLLSGIQNNSKSYYEAASLDGATKIQQFFQITLPMVSPSADHAPDGLPEGLRPDLHDGGSDKSGPHKRPVPHVPVLPRVLCGGQPRLRLGHRGMDRAADRNRHRPAVLGAEKVG